MLHQDVVLSERSRKILLSFLDICYFARARMSSSSDRLLRRCSAFTSAERAVFASPTRPAFL